MMKRNTHKGFVLVSGMVFLMMLTMAVAPILYMMFLRYQLMYAVGALDRHFSIRNACGIQAIRIIAMSDVSTPFSYRVFNSRCTVFFVEKTDHYIKVKGTIDSRPIIHHFYRYLEIN